MMTDAKFEKLKAKVDAAIVNLPPEHSIALGNEAYDTFAAKGLLKDKNFNIVGIPKKSVPLPTYEGRYTHKDDTLPLEDFKV